MMNQVKTVENLETIIYKLGFVKSGASHLYIRNEFFTEKYYYSNTEFEEMYVLSIYDDKILVRSTETISSQQGKRVELDKFIESLPKEKRKVVSFNLDVFVTK